MSLPPPLPPVGPPPMQGPPPLLAPPPLLVPPPVVQPPPQRGRIGRAAGAVFIVVGLAAGVLLAGLAMASPRATVERFARARAGCTTTLQFDRPGTFTLYVESKGRLSGVEGDCPGGDAVYEYRGDGSPRVTVVLEDADGNALPTGTAPNRSYDVGAYRGAAAATVTIREPGDYRLSVEADSGDVAVAVGGNPFADQRLVAMVAVVVTLLGVMLGATLVLMNRR